MRRRSCSGVSARHVKAEPVVKFSAGVLLYRFDENGALQVLIAHMGGPFWARKDERAWSIPKGEYGETEDPESAARREFHEEMGRPLPVGDLTDLGVFKQSSAKSITAYALEADFDAESIVSNEFEMEWPPRSGRTQLFPEVDRAAWFDCATAKLKLVKGQVPIVDRLQALVDGRTQSNPNQ